MNAFNDKMKKVILIILALATTLCLGLALKSIITKK